MLPCRNPVSRISNLSFACFSAKKGNRLCAALRQGSHSDYICSPPLGALILKMCRDPRAVKLYVYMRLFLGWCIGNCRCSDACGTWGVSARSLRSSWWKIGDVGLNAFFLQHLVQHSPQVFRTFASHFVELLLNFPMSLYLGLLLCHFAMLSMPGNPKAFSPSWHLDTEMTHKKLADWCATRCHAHACRDCRGSCHLSCLWICSTQVWSLQKNMVAVEVIVDSGKDVENVQHKMYVHMYI